MSDFKNWVRIFSSNDDFDVQVKSEKLTASGVNNVVINREDSMYPFLNEVNNSSLWVNNADKEKATEILRG
jgi:hypothetical protein